MATRDVTKQEDVVQAVVITDSYDDKFSPLDALTAKVLLPLVNCPMLEYTLEFLKSAGVQEVFLFCTSHADQIKEYIRTTKWGSSSCSMQLSIVVSETCTSVGDALRDIDAKALIRNDFILVMGDTVSNIQLKPILDSHKERRKKEKGSVMTMLYKSASTHHGTICSESRSILATDNSSRLLYFKKAGNLKKFSFDLELFQTHNEVSIMHDLLDCNISICSVQVPPLFSDNFDFQTRDDLVRGILENEEILGNTLHLHVIEDECYGARVSNITMYDALSRDIINRWVYPIVPDLIMHGNMPYSYHRHNIYKHKDVMLARGCILEENVIIGHGTKVGSNTVITRSVIGANCRIGDDVSIENAYIWDDVVIGKGCSVKTAVIANNVSLLEGVHISPGCILSAYTVIGPSVTLKEESIFVAEESGFDNGEINVSVVGTGGKAYAYTVEDEDDSDTDKDSVKDVWGVSTGVVDHEESDTESEDVSDRDSPLPDDTKLFYNEVLDSLSHGVDENVHCENLVLEVNSSKYAYNVTMKELNMLVVKAILEIHAARFKKQSNLTEYLTQLVNLFTKLLPFIQNYIKNTSSQMDLLSALQEYFEANDNYSTVFVKILQFFYGKDILSEEVILSWYEEYGSSVAENSKNIRDKIFPFIKWLQEAEEESSSE